ncbi:MAG: gliding motility-associated C-terminal domain-containing protein [Lewinellaceae bacterium]|nr:gliding motility-associated C-terminal domain-containing protein [Lewinellaceae bacterium]
MHQQLRLFFPLLAFIAANLSAQVTPPCPVPPPPGAENCQTTCVYCDFDGYMGINNGTPSGGNTVCGAIALHNDQWFGFIAGTTDITIDILTSNCQNGDGLQSAFFENCVDDAIVCNPGSGGGAGNPLTLSYSGFVPGQTYYLMIDGWSGDVCNFEIDVTNGSITPPPPGTAAQPVGPTMVCPGATVEYTIPPVDGAGYYQWTAPAGSSINGAGSTINIPAPDGTTVTVTFGNIGGNICVRTGNACFSPTPYACLPVVNQPVPPTFKPDLILCFDELPYTWDELPYTTISNTGTYNLTSAPYDNYLGCDSLIKQKITIKQQITSNIGFQYLCQDDCFVINGNTYCIPGGPFQEKMTSWQGCDSIVNFYIVKIPAVAAIAQPVPMISCNNPVLTLNSTGSTTGGNTTYTWTNVSWTPIGSMSTQTITNGGTFNLIVTNTGGNKVCKDTATVVVTGNTNPPGVIATGGVIGCLATNQMVNLTASSGTGGVNYLWSGPGITPANQNQQNPTVSTPGTYIVKVTNPTNACVSSDTVTVVADNTPPGATAIGDTITCGSPTVAINSSTNAPSVSYNWAGPGINAGNMTVEDPIVAMTGTYSVTITNTINGCTSTASTSVAINTTAPSADAGTDQIINCLQSVVVLSGSGNAGGAPLGYTWMGPGIYPTNQNLASPGVDSAGIYVLTVTNTLNGCTDTDTVSVGANLQPPTAVAGPDKVLNCEILSLVLSGTGSSTGPNFSALWSGPGITPANQNQLNPMVNQPGNYTITITNATNGCSTTDSVAVTSNTTLPSADAGADQTLTCITTNGVVLSGSGVPNTVNFLWSGPGIGANNEDLPNPSVTDNGTYVLQVTDPANGCIATDTVEVFQDADLPEANGGTDRKLNCLVTSVDFNGSASSSGPDITYQWAGPGISGGNATAQSPTGITVPGTYNLTVTNNSNNCVNTDVVVVQIDTIPPTVTAGPDLILNCYNNNIDTLNTAGSSAGVNFTYVWTGPDITPATQNLTNPPVSTPGNYTLVITNNVNNCSATDAALVNTDTAPPTADAGTDAIIDCIVTATQIGGSSSNGPDFSYTWTGPAITPANAGLATPTINLEGTYQITVTNTLDGCTATDSVLVTLNAVYPSALAGLDQIITCINNTVTIDGSNSSTGPEFQYTWMGPGINAGNQTQPTPNVSQPGNYILSITNTTNSCISTDTVVVTENTALPTVSAGSDQNLDCATLQVTLDGAGSSAGPNIQYLWSGAGITLGSDTLQSPSVSLPGNYTLVVTDMVNGCTAQDLVVINQDITNPVASAGPNITLTCAQAMLSIDGSGSSSGSNFEYVWQGPGINTGNYNLQSPMVSDSGTYILIVTNAVNHCTTTDTVYVDKDGDFPLAEAGATQLLTCAVTAVLLDGSQSQTGTGISYLWTGPGLVPGTETSLNPTANVEGNYTLTVTNTNNGCTSTDLVTVDKDVLPPIANAGSDQTLTCATINGVTISALASSSGPEINIVWSGPDINAANEGLAEPMVIIPGIYTLVVTNTLNGCTATDQVLVQQDQNLPMANAGSDLVIDCADVQVVLDASASTAGGPIEVLWSGPGINAANETQFMPLVDLPGLYTLVVTNTLTGCTGTDVASVTLDNTPPALTMSADTIDCDNPTALVIVNSSIPNCNFDWQGPGIPTGTQTNASITVNQPGSYTVIVEAPNGCSSTGNTVVEIDDAFPEGTVEGTVLNCFNNSMGTISGEVQSPAGATAHWSGPGGFFSTDYITQVTVPGTYIFTIEAPNGCTRMINVVVPGQFQAPIALATVPTLLDCNTPAVNINGNGSSVGNQFSYDWTTVGGNIVSGASTLSPLVNAPGTYTLQITNNNNGCTSSTSVQVTNDPSVPTGFQLSVQDVPCFGDNNGFIYITGIDGGTPPFFFSVNGSVASATAQFSQLGAGSYAILLEDAHGCLLDTTVNIMEPAELLVELGDDQSIQLGASVSVEAIIAATTTPVRSWVWSPAAPCADTSAANCLSYETIPQNSYIQRITVTDENGCVAEDQVLIQVRKDRYIYVPSIFNPDSDNPINSLLMIHGNISIDRVKSWSVYDRWGELVWNAENFQPDDPTFAWDGRLKGSPLTPGVFVWVAEVIFVDGETLFFTGDTTLFR